MPWTFKQIEPQPARGTLREEMWDDPQWIAEEKYDGDRRIAQFCGRVVRFTGRRKSVDGSGFVEKTENVPHLAGSDPKWHAQQARRFGKDNPWVEHMAKIPGRLPPASLDGTVLDGEMICEAYRARYGEGGASKHVTSIMGSLPEEAVRKQIERGWLRYVVFDCLFYKGKDVRGLPLSDRHSFVFDVLREWGNPFASVADSAQSPRKRVFRDEILSRGGEGVILKHVDHVYGDKKLWVKVKAEWTADVVIMGYKSAKEMSTKKGDDVPSMTKFAKAGLIGAVVVGQYGGLRAHSADECHEVATVSGMDDALRAKLTKDGKKYLGKVVEIAHNGREPTGRFRHPRFKRFRDDKAAKDCIYREGEI